MAPWPEGGEPLPAGVEYAADEVGASAADEVCAPAASEVGELGRPARGVRSSARFTALLAGIAAQHTHELELAVAEAVCSLREERRLLAKELDDLRARFAAEERCVIAVGEPKQRHQCAPRGGEVVAGTGSGPLKLSTSPVERLDYQLEREDMIASPPSLYTLAKSTLTKSSTSLFGKSPTSLPDVPAEESPAEAKSWCSRLDSLVINKHSQPRQVWNIVMLIMLLYVATIFPMRLAFWEYQIPSEPGADVYRVADDPLWRGINITTDVLFWCDLVLNFFFSYDDSCGDEVVVLRKIVLYYLRGYFLLDLCACVPPETFSGGPLNKAMRISRVQRFARSLRLMRLLRLGKILKTSKTNDAYKALQNIRFIRLFGLAISLFLVVHILACGWYIVAAMHSDPGQTWVARREVDAEGTLLLQSGRWRQWITAVYFVCTVFTTVGFGDMNALTEGEMVYVTFMMIIGCAVNGIITSHMVTVVTSADDTVAEREELGMMVSNFARHTHIEDKQIRPIKKWIQYNYSKRNVSDLNQMRILLSKDVLPSHLTTGLPRIMFGGSLALNNLVRNYAHDAKLKHLITYLGLKSTFCRHTAGDTIYHYGDRPLAMYLVLSGTFVALTEGPGGRKSSSLWHSPFRLYGHHTYFGDTELLLSTNARQDTLRCESHEAELLVFDKENLKQLLHTEFAPVVQQWRRAAMQREVHRRRCIRHIKTGKVRQPLEYKQLAAACIQRFRRNRQNRGRGSAVESNMVREVNPMSL